MTTGDFNFHIVVNMLYRCVIYYVARMDEHSSCSNAVLTILISIDDRVKCDDNS